MVPISPSICMHGHHGVCVLKKVSTSNNMHEVNRNRAAVHKSEPGSQESLNTLVSTPGRGFTGIYRERWIYIYEPQQASERSERSPLRVRERYELESDRERE